MTECKCNHKWKPKTICEPISNADKNLKRSVKYVCKFCGKTDIRDIDERYQDVRLDRFVEKYMN